MECRARVHPGSGDRKVLNPRVSEFPIIRATPREMRPPQLMHAWLDGEGVHGFDAGTAASSSVSQVRHVRWIDLRALDVQRADYRGDSNVGSKSGLVLGLLAGVAISAKIPRDETT